ncbi:hypothetical protein FDP41_001320 [Naegleria fowleri]|uniref:Uncharacterized protein n=1 Tax=Naegleria fowleri TaxID=5763 RepID=A0A6A5BYG5_NAEFO|nr:uncharacterized protein FDP41_001320 [Naegleria fowleri]KAF0979652.1 hypothetical protein FDP41_001320 [Naegleria fowleri]
MNSYWIGPNNEVSQVVNNNDHDEEEDEEKSITTLPVEVTTIASSSQQEASQQPQQNNTASSIHNLSTSDEDLSGVATNLNSYMDHILKTCYLNNLIVSYWDNSMGPRPLQVWNGSISRREYLSDDNIMFITRFSLMDDMPRYEEVGSNIEIKFNIMSDLNVMVLTAVFCSKNWEKVGSRSFFRRKADPPPTLFTISLVMNRDNLSRYMVINFIIKEKLITLAKILQHFADIYMSSNQAEVLSNFTPHLNEFIQLFDTLSKIAFEPPKFNLFYTLFHEESSLKRLYENEEDNLFFQRAVTSHLETHGYSVVVGTPNQLKEINIWVNTLAMFLSQHEKQLINHAQKIDVTKIITPQPQTQTRSFFKKITQSGNVKLLNPSNVFKPEVFVQGLVTTPDLSHWKDLIPTKCLLSGRYPITVVDLKERKVFSFKKYHYFQAFKREYFEESESKNILNDFGVQTTGGDKQFRDHYVESKRICTSVQELFYVLLRVIPLTIYPSIRCSLISEFVRLLNRKAIALARYVHSMRNIEAMNPDKIQRILMKHVMINNSVQKYHMHDLTSELFVIMATAEKLQHGVYTMITGDPQLEAFNVVDFLDSTSMAFDI